MRIGIWYWLIIFLWLILGCWNNWPVEHFHVSGTEFDNYRFGGVGEVVIQFALFVLIGIKLFGGPLKGD